MQKEDVKKCLREIGVIRKESVQLRSGEESDYYCDIKRAYGEPDLLNYFSEEIGKMLPPDTTCIAASGYGGLPLASCVASHFNKKLAAVRDANKGHGRGGLIDGYIPTSKDVVVIVDDVLTTGSSINSVLSVLKTEGVQAKRAIVVVKRKDPVLEIPCSAIFSIGELM